MKRINNLNYSVLINRDKLKVSFQILDVNDIIIYDVLIYNYYKNE